MEWSADANGVILRVNKAFIETNGYTAEEAVGQTPRLIESGLHDDDFHRAMWETVQRTGTWKGEVWGRRKNGELYPKWLTISAVRGAIALQEILLECKTMIEPQAKQRDIKINFPQLDISFFVYADPTRVKQVLINLLSNAIKYNREHGTVEVTCTANALKQFRISIKDTGEGLSP